MTKIRCVIVLARFKVNCLLLPCYTGPRYSGYLAISDALRSCGFCASKITLLYRMPHTMHEDQTGQSIYKNLFLARPIKSPVIPDKRLAQHEVSPDQANA